VFHVEYVLWRMVMLAAENLSEVQPLRITLSRYVCSALLFCCLFAFYIESARISA